MTAIIDYGVGNLFSLVSSFEKIGEKAVITADVSTIQSADRIILPGVGAFRDAAEKLKTSGLIPVLEAEIEKGKPVLGICLGMQLLFDRSFEYGEYKGLGLIHGDILPIADKVKNLKIPHMGWNALLFRPVNGSTGSFAEGTGSCSDRTDGCSDITGNCAYGAEGFHPLFKYIKNGDYVYFVHSYYAANCDENVIATSEYGIDITAAAARGNVMGCQFHPEKSGETGLNILRAFCEM